MGIVHRVKEVLFTPTSFFKKLKKETGVKTAFIYFLILSLFSTIMTALFSPFNENLASSIFGLPETTLSLGKTFGVNLINFLLSIPFTFVLAAAVFVWLLLFRGRQPYSKSYQLLVYSATPASLFSWIPLVGALSLVWYLVTLIIGTKQLYSFSTTRSIMAYITLGIVFFILITLFIALTSIYVFHLDKVLPSL